MIESSVEAREKWARGEWVDAIPRGTPISEILKAEAFAGHGYVILEWKDGRLITWYCTWEDRSRLRGLESGIRVN